MPTLEDLDVRWCRITNPPWDVLADLPRLSRLMLGGNPIRDDALAGVGRFRGLRSLDLSETRVTDRGLAVFDSMRWLGELNLQKTMVTEDGAKRLRSLNRWLWVRITEETPRPPNP